MRKKRTVIVLLAASLVAVGFSGRAWFAGKPARTNVFALNTDSALRQVGAMPRSMSPRDEVIEVPSRSHSLVATELPATPQQLSADANALVVEMCDLQLLAYDTSLTLNSRQWAAFAEVVLRTQAIRHAYEAQIASSTRVAPDLFRVEIPVYANVGDALREKFYTALRTELGEPTSMAVLAELGEKLEGRFAGFGLSAQTLDIAGNPFGAISDLRVTRTVTYWNSLEGSDTLTTRRQTSFPAWEDPVGESWSAILAMLKA